MSWNFNHLEHDERIQSQVRYDSCSISSHMSFILLIYVLESLTRTRDWKHLSHKGFSLTVFQSSNDSGSRTSCKLKVQLMQPKSLWSPSWYLFPPTRDVPVI